MTIRGISESVNAYQVIKPLPRPEKIRGIEGLRAEMIGREREFADLKDSVNELLSGRGQIVSIIGEAGVGKSRLVAEIRKYLDSMNHKTNVSLPPRSPAPSPPCPPALCLEGRCVSIGESIGYWVFIDMLRGYLDFAEDDTPETLREKIVTSMKSLFPQRWEEIVPYVANLLSVRSGEWDDRFRHLPPEQIKQQTFFVLRDVFFAMSQQKPLLLIFEDLHWADILSLDMINLLMDALTRCPLMLLCIYRPHKEHRSWHISAQASAKCLDRYREITLRPLSTQESRRLVRALLAIDNLPESIRESILQKAEGNPFFVEEVIRSLIESGVVYQDGDRWIANAEIEDITIPDTIQSVIMSRIDRLEDEARYVLQSASVIGRLFRHRLLGYITQQEQKLDEYLWKLEERDLVYEQRAIPELEYSFRHVLTQETAYNTILSRRRKEFHHRVAEGYGALYASRLEEYYEELAYHYSRSDDRHKALDYLVKAGDKSRKSFANDAAIDYYRQALKLIDDSETDAIPDSTIGHIYHSLSDIYFPLLKYEESLECCCKALEYVEDKRRRARIYGRIGWIYEQKHKLDTALEYLDAGIAELGDDTDCPEMARISIPLFWAMFHQGDAEKATEIAQRGLRIVEGTEHYFEIEQLCSCLANININYYRHLDKGYDYARKSLEAARKSDNLVLIGHASVRLGTAHLLRDEYDDAEELVREGIEIAQKTGDAHLLGEGYKHLSGIYEKMEAWDKAIECIEHCLGIPSHPGRAEHFFRLASVYARKGDDDTAIRLFKEAIEIAKKIGDRIQLQWGYVPLLEVYEKREDWDRTIKCLECVLEIPDHPIREWHLQRLANTYIFRGNNDKAITLFKEEIELAKKKDDNILLGRGYANLSRIYQKRKDWSRTIELLENCLKIPDHPDRTQHLCMIAYIYTRKGDAEKAIEYSKEALESAETVSIIALSVMEESFALAGRQEEFISHCKKTREEKGEALRDLKLKQWYLEPAEISEIFTQTAFVDEFDGLALRSEWEWLNPRGDSSYCFSKEGNWLEVHAASGSDLWENSHAPCLLQELSGNFAVEVLIMRPSGDLPSVGGLLVWVDRDNDIRFGRGLVLETGIRFSATVQGKYDCFGRGRLPSDVLHLRLERIGHVFSAYCSDDGENWLTCGCMEFPAEDPIKVGICAVGHVRPLAPLGGHINTATQFGSFRVLKRA